MPVCLWNGSAETEVLLVNQHTYSTISIHLFTWHTGSLFSLPKRVSPLMNALMPIKRSNSLIFPPALLGWLSNIKHGQRCPGTAALSCHLLSPKLDLLCLTLFACFQKNTRIMLRYELHFCKCAFIWLTQY